MLRSSHVQSQGIVDTLQEPLIVLDSSLTVVNANPAFFRTFEAERDDTLGQNLFELGNGQWDIEELRQLLAEVVPKASAVVGYRVTHDFPKIGRRTMLLTARRLQHPDENSRQMMLVFEDVTHREKADTDKDVLLAETRHRMKNLLAVLRAVASQTTTHGRSAEEYRDVFMGRFEAVLNAQTLLSGNGDDAEMSALVDQTLRPLAGSRANIVQGPPVTLASHQVLPVVMALHELATNALKYGALSKDRGVVHVRWTTKGDDGLHQNLLLDWREEGGPSVSPPSHQGFGMKLIQYSAAAEGGEAEFDFAPAGLHTRITLPLAQ